MPAQIIARGRSLARRFACLAGLRPASGTAFGRDMSAKFERKHTMYGKFYYGVGIRDTQTNVTI